MDLSWLYFAMIFPLLFGMILWDGYPNRLPVKSIDITIDVNHLEEFRAQLRKFADKHSLTFTESFYNKDNTFFSVEMNGDEFHIFLQNDKDSPGEFSLGIFNEATPPVKYPADS